MKRLMNILMLLGFMATSIFAQKTVYIPNEWKGGMMYKESDPDNKYTWSKSRSIESDNVIVFWDNGPVAEVRGFL